MKTDEVDVTRLGCAAHSEMLTPWRATPRPRASFEGLHRLNARIMGTIERASRRWGGPMVRAFVSAASDRSRAQLTTGKYAPLAGPLRVGVRCAGPWSRELTSAVGPLPIVWVEVGTKADDAAACRKYNLDGCIANVILNSLPDASAGVHRGSEAITCYFPRRAGSEQTSVDWARDAALQYTSVFPLSYATQSITFAIDHPRLAALALGIVTRGLLESRLAANTDLLDVCAGRFLPRDKDGLARPGTTLVAWPDLFDVTSRWLLARLTSLELFHHNSSLAAISARLLSMWASDCLCHASADERLTAANAAAVVLGCEPAILLRLAAVEVAFGSPATAINAAGRAHEVASRGTFAVDADHLLHLHAEVSAGCRDDLAMGRIAAGLSLAILTSKPNLLKHVSEDLLDELTYSAVFVGRDQDRVLLRRVFARLEQSADSRIGDAAGTADFSIGERESVSLAAPHSVATNDAVGEAMKSPKATKPRAARPRTRKKAA